MTSVSIGRDPHLSLTPSLRSATFSSNSALIPPDGVSFFLFPLSASRLYANVRTPSRRVLKQRERLCRAARLHSSLWKMATALAGGRDERCEEKGEKWLTARRRKKLVFELQNWNEWNINAPRGSLTVATSMRFRLLSLCCFVVSMRVWLYECVWARVWDG